MSRPQVIFKEIAGEIQEPYEHAIIDVDEAYQGGDYGKDGLTPRGIKGHGS